MTVIKASFYNGKTSLRKEVRIHFDPSGQMRVTGLEKDIIYALSDVRIMPRIGNTPRCIYLPGGAKCETMDNDEIDEILRLHGKNKLQVFLHKLESKLWYILLLLILTVVGVWGIVEYGIPMLAKRVAYALPASAESAMGREVLKNLDQIFFSHSHLEEKQKSQLLSLFENMTQEISSANDFRLEFRKGNRVGPNAFALPSGIIVVTDELILLSKHQNEIVAVFAHEIGHVMNRHVIRNLMQNSTMVLIIASITGDFSSITALSSTLPRMLVETKYSLSFEMEADRFALQYLRERKIPPKHFADFLLRLEKETRYKSEMPNYLSSHPPASQRVKMFRSEE